MSDVWVVLRRVDALDPHDDSAWGRAADLVMQPKRDDDGDEPAGIIMLIGVTYDEALADEIAAEAEKQRRAFAADVAAAFDSSRFATYKQRQKAAAAAEKKHALRCGLDPNLERFWVMRARYVVLGPTRLLTAA